MSRLTSREACLQYYIDLLNPEYNILKTAGSTLGHKQRSLTIAKFKNYKPSSLSKLRSAKELSSLRVEIWL